MLCFKQILDESRFPVNDFFGAVTYQVFYLKCKQQMKPGCCHYLCNGVLEVYPQIYSREWFMDILHIDYTCLINIIYNDCKWDLTHIFTTFLQFICEKKS